MNDPDGPRMRKDAILAPVSGLVLVAIGGLVNARFAVLALAVLTIAGALARLVMPQRKAFVVRSKPLDVTILGVLGCALLGLALTTTLD